MNKSTLNAVYENDLIPLLKKFNLYDKIKEGVIKCKFTKEVITLENIHSLFPEENQIKIVSNSPEAIKLLSEYINDKKIK